MKAKDYCPPSSDALPGLWHRSTAFGPGGAVYRNEILGLQVIVTATELDGHSWLHVSVTSQKRRLPTWQQLVEVKEAFIGPERKAIQVLPPRSEHVNIHEYCLHLWSCLDGDPLPDFTQGLGTI